MNAVLHFLINDNNLLNKNENLMSNKNLYLINYEHFLITNLKNPHTELYKNFQQIFYSKKIDSDYLSNILKTLIELKYEKFLILNSDFKQKKVDECHDINEFLILLSKFAVINHIIKF